MLAIRPWDRQPGEPPKAFQAFAIYRDLPYMEVGGTRSLSQVASILGYRNQRQVEKYSSKFEWVKRSSQFDTHVTNDRSEGLVHGWREQIANQQRIINGIKNVGLRHLADITQKVERGDMVLDTDQTLKYLDIALRLEQKLIVLEAGIGLPETQDPNDVEEKDVIVLPAKES